MESTPMCLLHMWCHMWGAHFPERRNLHLWMWCGMWSLHWAGEFWYLHLWEQVWRYDLWFWSFGQWKLHLHRWSLSSHPMWWRYDFWWGSWQVCLWIIRWISLWGRILMGSSILCLLGRRIRMIYSPAIFKYNSILHSYYKNLIFISLYETSFINEFRKRYFRERNFFPFLTFDQLIVYIFIKHQIKEDQNYCEANLMLNTKFSKLY